ncbi:hypothetical protein [Salipiger marinus]|uniref:hypothetical protein n=1 Tax=Salipiger marinus TaxID=555512 RepID=UPI004058C3D4
MDQEIAALLGRAPTEEERAIARDQRARVERGIFANPLLAGGPQAALASTDPLAGEGGA